VKGSLAFAALLSGAFVAGGAAGEGGAPLRAQTAPAVRITSPASGAYLTGPTKLAAVVTPESTPVTSVRFIVDGQLACTVDQAPWECVWDAGAGIREHVVRVLAQLPGEQRLVATVRSRKAGYVDAVDVHAVQISVIVKDRQGEFVKGLTVDDFELREDGVMQRVSAVADESSPLEVVMALDISASMGPVIGQVRVAARSFLDVLREEDAVTVLGFNDNIFVVARREARRETRQKALDRLAPWGGTALYDVIGRGVAMLQKQAGRKGLIVFSDGEDESSRSTLGDAERDLQSSDVVLYAVGLGRGARFDRLTKVLDTLSTTSGGSAIITRDVGDLPKAFREAVDDLAHSYVLSYVPKNTARDGGWRKVTVDVPGQTYRIRSRQGYLARAADGTSGSKPE
jgi:Ca-activated chloride channel homolog